MSSNDIPGAIRTVMARTNTTQTSLAASCGLQSQGTISNTIARGNCTVRTLVALMHAMNYEVVVRPARPRNEEDGADDIVIRP